MLKSVFSFLIFALLLPFAVFSEVEHEDFTSRY